MKKLLFILFLFLSVSAFSQMRNNNQLIFNVLLFGADTTGVIDATAAINNAIRSSQGNGGKVYMPRGTYTITVTYVAGADSTNKQGIRLLSGVELFGDGVGLTRIRIDTTGAGVTWDNSTFTTNGVFWPIISGDTVHDTKIHDLSINGNQLKQINFSTNAYTNASWNQPRKTIPGIFYKSGYGNQVYNVRVDSCQGYGFAGEYDSLTVVSNSVFTTNGNGGVGFHQGYGARTVSKSFITNNYSDNVRIESAKNVTIDNNVITWAKISQVAAPHNFAGVYCENRYSGISITNNTINNNSAYGIDLAPSDSTQTVIATGNIINNNGNAGLLAKGDLTASYNIFIDNGKTVDSVTDSKDTYLGAAIATGDTYGKVISNNQFLDYYGYQIRATTSGWYGSFTGNYIKTTSPFNLQRTLGSSSVGTSNYNIQLDGNSITSTLTAAQSTGALTKTWGNFSAYETYDGGGGDTLKFGLYQYSTLPVSTVPLYITGTKVVVSNLEATTATVGGSSIVTGSGTSTRVAFWGGSSSLSSSSSLYWDNSNSRLGIGTSSPSYDLHVLKNAAAVGLNAETSSNSGNAYIAARTASGFFAGQLFGSSYGSGVDNTALLSTSSGITGGMQIATVANAPISFRTNGTSNERMTILGSGNVGIGWNAPTSTLTVVGSLGIAINSTATSTTLTGSHYTMLISATGQTITLPTAVGIAGRIYVIKLTASGTGTVATTSSQTIDGSTTYSLSAQWKYVHVQSDGANWVIIANN